MDSKYKLGDKVWIGSAVSRSKECPTCKYNTLDHGYEAEVREHTVIGILHGGCGKYSSGKAISEAVEYIISNYHGGVSEDFICATKDEALRVANELVSSSNR
jgi:hypothetical protein